MTTLQVRLQHRTQYRFDRPTVLSAHEVRLRPAPHARTPILGYSLEVGGEDTKPFMNWQQDAYGNWVSRLDFQKPLNEFELKINLTADLQPVNPFDFFTEPESEYFPFDYEGGYPERHRAGLAPFLNPIYLGEKGYQWVKEFKATLPEKIRTVDVLVAINQQLYEDINYLIRMEPGVRDPEETLSLGNGSCRDTCWLLANLLRAMGLAARFVSGYLIQLKPDPTEGDAPTKDFTDLHAWTEVFIPGAGWVGLDPTSGLLTSEGHIPLSCTPTPEEAAPVYGFTSPCESEFDFSMIVERIQEAPRHTFPYTDDTWQAIDAMGERVDVALNEAGLKLTQGGEPTFIATNNSTGPEWNFTALSPEKRVYGETLLERLANRLGAEGTWRHAGQGKWYPGETLPRWILSAFWRQDGQPIWRDTRWLATPATPKTANVAHAKAFLERLAVELGVQTAHILPAYEDPYYTVWLEQQTPIDIDPANIDLESSEERQRLARLLQQGLNAPVGFLLPISALPVWPSVPVQWASSRWPVRAAHIYLIPGESPMGLRLPLSQLPVNSIAAPVPSDPMQPCEPLPARLHKSYSSAQFQLNTSDSVSKTAICAEVRDGQLYIFFPPLSPLEQYLTLVEAVEATASALQMPVVCEGYAPPKDPRVQQLAVTPDPGVLEVNVPPLSKWSELRNLGEILYEEAREVGLSAHRFMIDGRPVGTGGGNHIIFGGATPSESPWLNNPKLLKQLVVYIQNHPVLSYLFAGSFVGATSQSPRVDETREDRLHDLDIALQQLEVLADDIPKRPWLVDCILRHFLTDLTGNTHRAEISIDKLYSPDHAQGRLGLLEFRAFEMTPHPRMHAVQSLLLRAIIARLARAPYAGELIRWGRQLHDRFMLPHYLESDLRSVLKDLAEHDLPLAYDWFTPFLEFRFPVCGTFEYESMAFELRYALEPWNVLGEELSTTGTSRFVDNSVERVQIKLQRFIAERYSLLCNDRPIPVQATTTAGEYVAGVRFQAWNPPSAQHSTLPVQSPLVFTLWDKWNQSAVAGCTYFVAHAGGRSYDMPPVNAREAESRRRQRFWNHGMTTPQPGVAVRVPAVSPDQPCTLDLRWGRD
ncbi:MAG: transglutaminase family protein [Pseudomonadota bacterium]